MKEIPRWYLFIIITFPLSALVNLAIKRHILLALISIFSINESPKFWPFWFLPIANLIAPLTEEPIKILPIIFTEARDSLKEKRRAYILGLLLGAGFGIGEAWYLAISFTLTKPEYAFGLFFDLIGFFSERFLVVIVHGLLTAVLLFGFKKSFVKYFFIAVGFHYLLNIGAALYQRGILSIWATTVPLLLSLLIFLKYVFKIEQQLRRESLLLTTKEIFWTKD